MRTDGRKPNEIRQIEIIPEFNRHAEGSVLIKFGDTHLICAASVEEAVPKWLQGTGKGWVSAEYAMLPRATHNRIKREKAYTGGRVQEISRLIGRSLRAAVDLQALGEKQIYIDCDVIQADGGTRTAAITGGYVAMALCFNFLKNQGALKKIPLKSQLAAVSVGIDKNEALLDLNYDEDSNIDTDMNFVMTHKGEFIEIQGTAEGEAFTIDELNKMIALANLGCKQLFNEQNKIIGEFIQF